MLKIKTSELNGEALDWAVMKANGDSFTDEVFNDEIRMFKYSHSMTGKARYSSNWAIGGPVIEREGISVWARGNEWAAESFVPNHQGYEQTGQTPLIAAMRCYVARKMGDVVEIPEELIKE